MSPRLVLLLLLLGLSPYAMSLPPAQPDAANALHLAVISLKVDEVERLLESGVDPNTVSAFGQGVTPLGRALAYAAPDLNTAADRRKARVIVELLMRHGADPGLPGPDDYGRARSLREYARDLRLGRELEKLERRYPRR